MAIHNSLNLSGFKVRLNSIFLLSQSKHILMYFNALKIGDEYGFKGN